MRFHGYFIIMVLCLACRPKEEWVFVKESPITEAVYAPGTVEPKDEMFLTSLNEGYVREVFAGEGDIVSKNALLFVIDNRNAVIEESAARKNLALAAENASPSSPNFLKLRRDLSSARVKLQTDSLQYFRILKLFESQSVAQIEVENAKTVYEASRNSVASIGESIKSLEITMKQNLIAAQSQYESASIATGLFELRSPDHFKVFKNLKKPGEFVKKGEPVALLGHPDSLFISLLIDEASISKIKAGQSIVVELNSSKGAFLKASVREIHPYFDSEMQAFKVDAVFQKPPVGVFAGTQLQANVIVETKESALVIPRSSMNQDGKVVVRRGDVIDTVTVQTGIISNEWVEITNGLKRNDKILKSF